MSIGSASSQSGTSEMRAVPLRMAILPPQRSTRLRICFSPCPRPGSRKRVTPWMKAASSAVESLQRSPKRAACSRSSEPRNPTPRSTTAITTTRLSTRRQRRYVWIPTQPGESACSTMFCDTSLSSMLKAMLSAGE